MFLGFFTPSITITGLYYAVNTSLYRQKVSLELAELSLRKIMDHLGIHSKSSETALHHIKLKQVMNPVGSEAKLASVDSSAIDVYIQSGTN